MPARHSSGSSRRSEGDVAHIRGSRRCQQVLMVIGALLLGIVLASVIFIAWTRARPRDEAATGVSAQNEAERIIEEAKSRSQLLAKEAELKAKDLLVEARATAERELRDSRRELTALETKLQNREETLEKRLEG